MKILHYISVFSHLSETFIYDLLRHLEYLKEFEQIVVCHKRINEISRPFTPLVILPYSKNPISMVYRRFSIRRWSCPIPLESSNVLERHKPHIIHCHFGVNAVRMAAHLRQNIGSIPMVVHCHGTDIISLPHQDKIYRDKLLSLSKYDNVRFVANTNYLKQKMIDMGIPKASTRVVNYSVNPSFINSKKRSNFSETTDAFRVISVGRLIAWKGHTYLIEGLAYFLKRHPQRAKLTLIGDGPERKKLEKQVKKLNLVDRVTFEGSLEHHQVAEALQRHDLLIQPSIIDPKTQQCEAFGMTVIEAIAVGLPVAVTNSGGMPELVQRETPWSRIIEPASSSAISQVLFEFQKKTWGNRNNRDYAKELLRIYSKENQTNSIMKIYQEFA